MSGTDLVGTVAIARAMGIPSHRARYLLEHGHIRREWRLDCVFVVKRADLDAWLKTEQAQTERSIELAARRP